MENKLTVFPDVSYGNHERHRVDIFIPQKPKSQMSLILFIHGGGWHDGDKEIHRSDAEFFCNQGYVCATINYRFVTDELSVFNELDDITSALEAIKNKCAQYGFNIEKVLLSGGSAGAHLALLYAYTRKEEAPVTPVAVCAYCPPVNCTKPDFLMGISGEFQEWKYEILSKCCGVTVNKENLLSEQSQNALERISPENYVSGNVVPTAVFHGDNDELIPFEHIKAFVALLNEKGVKNDFLVYENSGHLLDKTCETAVKAKEIIRNYAEMYLKQE
ncbi:MAG: alpha/beta hydrolase [Clostridia bacterium]|nr:alpha/beta hydrolase [Clostridia bacterium]